MQKINGTTIYLTKGDTFESVVSITDSDGHAYTPVEGDVIRFAMKMFYDSGPVLINKVIPNDTMLLRLESSDTKDLYARSYVYDIQLTHANGDVDTFIAQASLILGPEVD